MLLKQLSVSPDIMQKRRVVEPCRDGKSKKKYVGTVYNSSKQSSSYLLYSSNLLSTASFYFFQEFTQKHHSNQSTNTQITKHAIQAAHPPHGPIRPRRGPNRRSNHFRSRRRSHFRSRRRSLFCHFRRDRCRQQRHFCSRRSRI